MACYLEYEIFMLSKGLIISYIVPRSLRIVMLIVNFDLTTGDDCLYICPWCVSFASRQDDFQLTCPDGQVGILEKYQKWRNIFPLVIDFEMFLCGYNKLGKLIFIKLHFGLLFRMDQLKWILKIKLHIWALFSQVQVLSSKVKYFS